MPDPATPAQDTPLRLGGNHSFDLQTQPGAWKILSGQLDLFAAPLENGAPAGMRRHLFRLGQDEWLFHAPQTEATGMGFVAVTAGEVQLAHLSSSDLGAIWRDASDEPPTPPGSRRQLARALQNWSAALLGGSHSARPAHRLESTIPGTVITLADGQPAPGDSLHAARVLEGTLTAKEPVFPTLNPQSGWFILGAPGGFSAAGPTTLATSSFEDLPDFDAVLQALARLHEAVALSLSAQADLENSLETTRIKQRTLSQSRTFSSAVAALASLVAPPLPGPAATGTSAQDLLHAACSIIGREIDVEFPPVDLQDPGTIRDPVSAMAHKARVRVRTVILSDDWWKVPNTPILGYLREDKRPVALIPSGSRSFRMVDPGGGADLTVTSDLAARIDPTAHMFYMPLPEREVTTRDILLRALRGNWADFCQVIGLGLLVGLIGLLLPIMTGVVFDTIIPAGETSQLFQVGFALGIAALASTGLGLASNIAMLRIEGKSDNGLQAAIWDRLLSLPPSFFRSFSAGDLALRANGINAIRQILSGTALSTLLQSVFSVFSLALLFYYSWQMALLALGLVLVAVAASLSIALLQLRCQRKTLAAQGRLAGTVLQFLSGLAKLRTSGSEARAFARWTERFVEMKSCDIAATQISNIGTTFNSVFSGLCTIAIFCVYFFFMKGTLATGDFLSYNAAFGQFMGSLLATSSALVTLLNAAPIYERAKPILTTLPEVDASKSHPGKLTGAIEISHLKFTYASEENPVLKGVSLQIRPGQFVAVVGSSGSGKSTILRLLLGFEKAPACSIFYNGQDIQGLDVLSLRRQIGVVLQNGRILSGDIFHNIIGASRLTLEDAWAAAEAVGLAEDIRSMPMGMHTHVAEGGSTLSGGQRQRLLIARAMVHRPPILMLDEATSALDNRTQEMVSRSMQALKVSRLVIAHRLSTIVGADRIYVLDKGTVVQEGSYEELIGVDGPFRELSKRQIE